MIRWFVFFGFCALAFVPFMAVTDGLGVVKLNVGTESILLNPADSTQTTIDKLVYRGGLVLRSQDRRFGGWSGLEAAKDGRSLVAVSDKGRWLHLGLRHDAAGNLAGITSATLSPILDNDGDALDGKRQSDAEGLAVDAAGNYLVSFERRHRIQRHAGTGAPDVGFPLPAQLTLAPINGGIEALAQLPDGRILALTEGFSTSKGLMGWIGAPDPKHGYTWETVTYPADGRNVPTGATTLPNGDVLVLERRYSKLEGVGARLRRVPAHMVVAGSELGGEILADLREPLSVDNFEGISTYTGPDGTLRIIIISDDNFSGIQRTLLLSFSLK